MLHVTANQKQMGVEKFQGLFPILGADMGALVNTTTSNSVKLVFHHIQREFEPLLSYTSEKDGELNESLSFDDEILNLYH
jgi:hypothetical protein